MKFNNALPAVALIVFSTIVIALRRSKTGVSRVSFPKPIPYRVSFPKPIPYRVSFSPTPTKFNTTSYSCEPNLQLQPRPIQPRKGAIHEIENLRLKLPPDSIYSNLKLTYDRIVLPESNCQDVFISVRTAAPFHKSRLPLLLYTWLQTVNPKQVQILTDFANDTWINATKVAGFRVVTPPHCTVSHSRTHLCCKTGYELEQYYKATEAGKRYRWYCHFDDDEYVNIQVLMRTLHEHKDKSYLGHFAHWHYGWRKIYGNFKRFPGHKRKSFYYASGQAYCISSAIMTQLEKYVRGSKNFMLTCDKFEYPDDMAVGALIEAILGYDFTEISTMYSEDHMEDFRHYFLKDQVTITYRPYELRQEAKCSTTFTKEEDPTGFLSHHCMLYPSSSWCRPN